MLKKQAVLSCACVLLSALLIIGFGATTVSGWSNGDSTGDPAHPGYGTHDWIAEHALDWLPPQEKQFFTENREWYLYGTELPDNKSTPGGVGDAAAKHHVYFYANGTVQNNASAVRAGEEYENAKQAFAAGNFSAAAMHLGMVTHYIDDLAVFGHVMGSETAWGTETHHGIYEDYVERRTQNYASEFDSYLGFDGILTSTTAYDAALAVAYDTTFGGDSGLNCTWMDQHYNWSNAAFKNRCGESLNLTVTLIVEVLHSFYTEAIIPEFPRWTILPLFIVITLLVVAMKKKSLSKRLIH
jgi:hypothetical protein